MLKLLPRQLPVKGSCTFQKGEGIKNVKLLADDSVLCSALLFLAIKNESCQRKLTPRSVTVQLYLGPTCLSYYNLSSDYPLVCF